MRSCASAKPSNALSEAAERAQLFLHLNAELLTAVDFTTARHWLDDVVTSFTEHATDQEDGDHLAQEETAKQRHLCRKLGQEPMAAIAVLVRWKLRSVPEFEALQMPKRSLGGQEFIAGARSMADAVAIYRDTFVAHGLPATFLDEFQSVLAVLAESLRERELNRTNLLRATRGIASPRATPVRCCGCSTRSCIERGDNESLLRGWQAARQVDLSTVTSRASAEAA